MHFIFISRWTTGVCRIALHQWYFTPTPNYIVRSKFLQYVCHFDCTNDQLFAITCTCNSHLCTDSLCWHETLINLTLIPTLNVNLGELITSMMLNALQLISYPSICSWSHIKIQRLSAYIAEKRLTKYVVLSLHQTRTNVDTDQKQWMTVSGEFTNMKRTSTMSAE